MMWLLVIVSVLLDQLTKYWVCKMTETVTVFPHLLSFSYVENYGAVFGMMQGSNAILAVLSAVICVVLVWYLFKQKQKQAKISAAWYLILAGGIGNLIDRVFRGYVVDFIATPFIATFNLADSFVVIGVAWVCFLEIHQIYLEKRKAEK